MSASLGQLGINFSDARYRPCSQLYVPDKCCSDFVNVIGAISRSLQKVQSFKNELSGSLWTAIMKKKYNRVVMSDFHLSSVPHPCNCIACKGAVPNP